MCKTPYQGDITVLTGEGEEFLKGGNDTISKIK